ncbi:MAG: sialate O-acetylesterase [Bacteroidia bacterium]|nr:sialate O-acetylesterase [Bacteroidia bacterium]
MKKISVHFVFLLFTIIVNAQIKVACIGNSITFGHGLNRDETYPAQLQEILGADWTIRNFGVSGRTLLTKGDYPYIKEKAYADAKTFEPDVAIIMLGTNDAKPQNWKFRDEFTSDYTSMINELKSLPSKPLIMVCLPVPAYGINFNINDSIVNNQVVSLARTVAKKNNAILVNLHKPFMNHPEWFPDKIHPNKEGAGEMARVLSKKFLKYKRKITRRKL